MELKWLEDFVAVAELGHFARSATNRRITQSALSRRIQSLESWVGAELLDRSSHPIQLTDIGEAFIKTAREIIYDAYEAQANARNDVRLSEESLTIACLHTLSLTFIPTMVGNLQKRIGSFPTSISADMRSFEDYIESLRNGSSDLFVCYDHPAVPTPLDLNGFVRFDLASTQILPYQKLGRDAPDLDAAKGPDIPLLAYSPTTYMYRIVEHCIEDMPARKRLKTVYRASLAESILTATQEGLGLSWLPRNVAPGTAEENGLMMVSDAVSTNVRITAFMVAEPISKIQERLFQQLSLNAEDLVHQG
ncbi:LysR family transcriptional regulator [Algimonas porphyrae]|uniref:LysR family transcriptional regulator n=1 Tax=Algimonas porphyrae TaxID=1128113 RepID=A0ABQ5V4G5_9PROT|nr:LysR family transcriptional regulator [Algimonas porphyrae]GLQ21957.1 LysR family transcriptional regulator [Algimonas porphyrae]